MLKTRDKPNGRNWNFVFMVSAATILLVGSLPLSAQEKAGKESRPGKLFSSEETIKATITAPWRALQRNRENQQPYPGKLEYRDDQGNLVTLDVTVQRRGVKRQAMCEFPPIRLRFEKEEVKGTMFRGQDSLKLVTHCESPKRFDQYYILEMLAYRIYNLISDFSFRVRPLEITYLDDETGTNDETRFAFLIEDDSDVAKRQDLKKIKTARVRLFQLEPRVTSEMSLFQYLIGNVDWSSLDGPDIDSCCHNTKIIGPEPLQAGEKVYPIPYDFDSSGLVDADYAVPPNGLPIDNVTKRLYRGFCVFNDELESTRQLFLQRESAIYSLLNDEDRLSANSRSKAEKYIGKFFKTIKNRKYFERLVIRKCRK